MTRTLRVTSTDPRLTRHPRSLAAAEERARRLALLDAKLPGWEDEVDLRTLDVSSCTECVVGQLFGIPAHYLLYRAYDALGVDEPPRLLGFALNERLGHRVTYGGLTTAWKRAIRARRRSQP